jgi:hypothetical protein
MVSLLQILLCMSYCFHQWRITLSKIIDGKPAFLGMVDFQSSFANVKGFHLGSRYSPFTHRHPNNGPTPQLIRVQMFNDDVSVYSLSYVYSLAENDCSDIQFTPANT